MHHCIWHIILSVCSHSLAAHSTGGHKSQRGEQGGVEPGESHGKDNSQPQVFESRRPNE